MVTKYKLPIHIERLLNERNISRTRLEVLYQTIDQNWSLIRYQKISKALKILTNLGMSNSEAFVIITAYASVKVKKYLQTL